MPGLGPAGAPAPRPPGRWDAGSPLQPRVKAGSSWPRSGAWWCIRWTNASPRRLIAEDNEGGLFTVTLFRKVIDDFKTKAKENK